MGPLMRRIQERQGTFQVKVEAPRKARWVELNINTEPTFDKPRVAVKELTRG